MIGTRTLEVVVPEPVAVAWPSCGYKSVQKAVQGSMPNITEGCIDLYFNYRVASDRECVQDLKSLSKGKALLESESVQACSYVQDETAWYFSGMVQAAMRKKVPVFNILIDLL